MALWTLFPLLSLAVSLVSGQGYPTLTTSEINAYRPYAFYASTGYCAPSTTINWSCGGVSMCSFFNPVLKIILLSLANCEANPTFKPFASGGNGDTVQYWFVGYDPVLDTVMVVHQGTIIIEV